MSNKTLFNYFAAALEEKYSKAVEEFTKKLIDFSKEYSVELLNPKKVSMVIFNDYYLRKKHELYSLICEKHIEDKKDDDINIINDINDIITTFEITLSSIFDKYKETVLSVNYQEKEFIVAYLEKLNV